MAVFQDKGQIYSSVLIRFPADVFMSGTWIGANVSSG